MVLNSINENKIENLIIGFGFSYLKYYWQTIRHIDFFTIVLSKKNIIENEKALMLLSIWTRFNLPALVFGFLYINVIVLMSFTKNKVKATKIPK